ncbi:MAG: DNA polymerase III subunit beta [bacterium]
MQIVIERDAFLKSLGRVQGIVEKKNAMPILSNTLLKAEDDSLEIVATDLEVTITDRCPVDVQSAGSITLSARKLHDIIRELPAGPVYLSSGEDYRMEVKSENDRFELMGLSPEDYPKVPSVEDHEFIRFPAGLITEMVTRTIYAAAGEDSRFSLNGIYTEKLEDSDTIRMVTTDGHRLALIDRQSPKLSELNLTKSVLLPRKGMGEVIKILEEYEGEVGVSIQEKSAAFKMEDAVIFMRLVDGKFPDYNRVIIEGCDKKAVIKCEELLKHLRRASTMVDEKARAVKFTFTENKLAMDSRNPNFGTSYSELEINYEGEKMVMAFNDRYFIDIMNVTKAENLIVHLRDEQSPAVISIEEDPNYTCVIMPMRV